MEKMINSQSAAAVNSANVVFTSNCSKSGYLQMPISNVNYDDVITFVGNTIAEQKKDAYFKVRISNGISMDISFTKNYFSKKYEISYRVFVNGELDYDACGSIELDFKVMSGVNVNNAVGAVARLIMEFIEAAEIAEAPALEEAPGLDEVPSLDEATMLEEDDDITDEGYSVEGLAYVKENTSGVSMADIIRKVAEEHWDFESVVKESQWTRFTNDSFRDLIWSTCWNEYLMDYTDEALEAETRYVMDFDAVYNDLFGELWPYMSTYDNSCGGCELWVDEWYVVTLAAEIIEESMDDSVTRCIDWDKFPDYMMTAFLDDDLYGFDTFTERVMSELEGGDIVDIMPYDDGLHLSFVNDEAEVAA